MSVYCVVNQTMKLSDTTKKVRLNEPLAYSNSRAHAFRVTVLADDSDEAADLTGVAVSGRFMSMANDTTVTPILGTVSDNVAEVILPGSCYLAVGRFRFTMDLSCSVSTEGVDAFSTSTAYAIGDRVVYDSAVWVFTADHSAGAWTGEDAQIEVENRTALWVEGMVERNTTETIIDPGTPVSNIDQAIANCNAAAAEAEAAAAAVAEVASVADTTGYLGIT